MKKTKIEWCDSTWNPVTGCRHGCEYCYARRIAERFRPFDMPHVTEDGIFKGINDLATPIITECKDGKDRICAYPYGFEPTFHRYRLDEPERWTKPRTIFVCSMADLFGDWVPDSWIEDVFAACEKAPQHRYLFLTKNPQRYVDLADKGKLPIKDNMWYGTTSTKPKDPFFCSRNEFNTFISIEPILEKFDYPYGHNPTPKNCSCEVKWIILGAETGNRKGKVTPKKEWIDKFCYMSDITQTPIFMKNSLVPIVGEENMRREFPWREGRKR